LPYHSLELLFQDVLRVVVPPGPSAGVSEIEVKFDLADVDLQATASAMVGWLSNRADIRLLLPFPHQIVRMRRYHFCIGDDRDAQCTVVETTAGRLSAKVKRSAEVRGRAVVRHTTASRSTDLDGVRERPEDFIARHGWRRVNMMTKLQAKIPFALRSGTAYLASIDDCLDPSGTPLRQLELEYIGSIGAPPGTDAVLGELEALSEALSRDPPGLELRPSTQSKHDYFLGRVPS